MDINYIKSKPNTLFQLIEKYPDKHWNWKWISYNPNITMEIIEKYPIQPRSWKWISINKFLYEKKVYEREIKKDIYKRQQTIKNIFNEYLYKDLINVLVDFVYWN